MSLGKLSTAERLKQLKPIILERWEQAVREQLPGAQGEQTSELRDSLPKLLDQMVDALASLTPKETLKAIEKKLGQKHGEERAEKEDYSLEEMLREYHILVNIIFDELEKSGPVEARDREILLDAMFTATRNAAAIFTAIRTGLRERIQNQKLTKAEKLHELVVESVKDYAIFTLDPKGYITTWNPGCMKMKQYTSDEALGRHFEMLYPPQGRLRNEPMDHLKTAVVEGRFRGEGMRMKKDGSLFFSDVTITPLFLDGVHIGFGNVVQNLDERKQLIQERDLSRSEAEDLRVERGLIERFVATLTHDLRTPLTAVKAGAQLIWKEKNTNPLVERLAHRIHESMERMDTMIHDLLDVSKIRSGKALHVKIEKCDLHEISSQVLVEMTTIYGDRFALESDEGMEGYWCPSGIKRILENLMVNSVKYGTRGTEISVNIRRLEDRALLSVHNFGPMIPPDDQSALFEQYRRAKTVELGSAKGWGLGLTLVRGLSESHGGRVKVESYPKEGTRFTVDLPMDSRPFNTNGEK